MADEQTIHSARTTRHIREARKQHIGGIAGVKGVRFQDLVSVGKLLDFAAYDYGENPFVEQEKIDSWTDDLHVDHCPEDEIEPGFSLHFQIKSDEKLYWSQALIDQFLDEHEEYPGASLILHVHSETLHARMQNQRHLHGLGFVFVEHTDIGWIEKPYLNPDYIAFMDMLSLMPVHRNAYIGIWNDVYSTWLNTFACKGYLYQVFDTISKASNYTISCLIAPTQCMNTLVFKLGEAIPALSFSADGETLVVSYAEGRGLVALPVAWADIDDEFWNDFPADPWEFRRKIGGFTSPAEDEDDDDQ